MEKAQFGAIIKGVKAGVKVAKGVFKTERAAAKELKLAEAAKKAAAERKAEIARKAAATRKANAEKKAAAANTKSSTAKPKVENKKATTAKPTTPKPKQTKPVKPAGEPKTVKSIVKNVGKGTLKYVAPAAAGYYAGTRKKKTSQEIVNNMRKK